MSTTTPVTADELLRLVDDSMRYELISGELTMMSPAVWRHGELVFRLSLLIGRHVEQQDLGRCFGAETGFLLARKPDTVLAPDIAFISQENLPEQEPEQAYWPGAPDLVVEVRSPQESDARVFEKTARWIAAGAQVVWDVNPAAATVTISGPATEPVVLVREETLQGGEVLPGFSVALKTIFD